MRITVYRFIMAATAALAAGALAVSCSKEPVAGEHGGGGSDGVRTISVSFGGGTKTALGDKKDDGTIPAEFKAGDVILVSNGSALEDCKVIIGSDGGASITTTLKGALNAVYPPEAAVYLGYNITGFKVSDSQSGRFEDAHICTATIPEGTTEAHFSNKTAILKFYVDASIGVTSIKITSSGPEIATGSKTITVTAPRGKTLAGVTDDTKKRICYVSVLPGVKASELTYETVTTTQPTLPRTPTDNVELVASKLYKAFMPYYITIGSQRWGYCNVGAFLPEEAGKYFAWGDTEGQYAATTGANAFTKPFNWANAPFNNGSPTFDQEYFDTQKSTVCPGGILALEYDAAYKNWGESWRMPTGMRSDGADIVILAKACRKEPDTDFVISLLTASNIPTDKGVYRYNGTGVKGIYFVDASGSKLFFPALGRGVDASIDTLYPSGTYGFYWSGTLNSTEGNADRMDFNNLNLSLSLGNQFHYGYLVRPIFDNTWTMEDYDDGGDI